MKVDEGKMMEGIRSVSVPALDQHAYRLVWVLGAPFWSLARLRATGVAQLLCAACKGVVKALIRRRYSTHWCATALIAPRLCHHIHIQYTCL